MMAKFVQFAPEVGVYPCGQLAITREFGGRHVAEALPGFHINAPMYEYFTNTSAAIPDSSSTPCTEVSMYLASQPR